MNTTTCNICNRQFVSSSGLGRRISIVTMNAFNWILGSGDFGVLESDDMSLRDTIASMADGSVDYVIEIAFERNLKGTWVQSFMADRLFDYFFRDANEIHMACPHCANHVLTSYESAKRMLAVRMPSKYRNINKEQFDVLSQVSIGSTRQHAAA